MIGSSLQVYLGGQTRGTWRISSGQVRFVDRATVETAVADYARGWIAEGKDPVWSELDSFITAEDANTSLSYRWNDLLTVISRCEEALHAWEIQPKLFAAGISLTLGKILAVFGTLGPDQDVQRGVDEHRGRRPARTDPSHLALLDGMELSILSGLETNIVLLHLLRDNTWLAHARFSSNGMPSPPSCVERVQLLPNHQGSTDGPWKHAADLRGNSGSLPISLFVWQQDQILRVDSGYPRQRHNWSQFWNNGGYRKRRLTDPTRPSRGTGLGRGTRCRMCRCQTRKREFERLAESRHEGSYQRQGKLLLDTVYITATVWLTF